MSLLPLDGPASQLKITVTTGAVVELRVGATPLVERKMITVQSDKSIYVYFASSATPPSVATVQNNGFVLFKDSLTSFEASDTQRVFTLAVSSTSNVVLAERA